METESLINHTCKVCFTEEEAEKFRKDDLNVMEGRKQIIIEEKIIDSQKNEVWLETIKSPILDKSGKVIETVGIARDITKRKHADKAVNIGRKQLVSIFDSIDEVVYVSDPKTYELLYVNESGKAIFGKDIVGKNYHNTFQNLDKPCDFCTNHMILGDNLGKPYIWEY